MDFSENYISEIIKSINLNKDRIIKNWECSTHKNIPTKHIIIDNLLPTKQVDQIYKAFPKNADGFFKRETFREKKKTATNLKDYDKHLSDITYALQSKQVVGLIGDLLNIDSLEGDPSLYAGGISMMFKDDFLNPHIDNSHDAKREKYRRLNLLYYVSPAWNINYGGNFELWDKNLKKQKTIVAKQNRLVIMETNTCSWHSVSKVKIDRPRCCISNYYFSNTSPEKKNYFHITSFTGRPEDKLKRFISKFDNSLRNSFAKIFKLGRNKKLINKK